jgi:hypothetical protein
MTKSRLARRLDTLVLALVLARARARAISRGRARRLRRFENATVAGWKTIPTRAFAANHRRFWPGTLQQKEDEKGG